jgi:hypothetical protein
MTNIKRLIIIISLFLLSSCNQEQKTKDSQLALIKTTNPSPVTTDKNQKSSNVERIKKDVSSFPEIYDVAVVEGKKNTLVVYKVKHLYRYKMKKIEKNINNLLEKRYPNENFTVSSDYKIFLEAVKLNERIQSDKQFSKQKAEKQLQQIIEMTKEMT